MNFLVENMTRAPSQVLVRSASSLGEEAAKVLGKIIEESLKNCTSDITACIKDCTTIFSNKVSKSVSGFGQVFKETGVEGFTEWGIGIERAFYHLGQKIETGLYNSSGRMMSDVRSVVHETVDQLDRSVRDGSQYVTDHLMMRQVSRWRREFHRELMVVAVFMFIICLSIFLYCLYPLLSLLLYGGYGGAASGSGGGAGTTHIHYYHHYYYSNPHATAGEHSHMLNTDNNNGSTTVLPPPSTSTSSHMAHTDSATTTTTSATVTTMIVPFVSPLTFLFNSLLCLLLASTVGYALYVWDRKEQAQEEEQSTAKSAMMQQQTDKTSQSPPTIHNKNHKKKNTKKENDNKNKKHKKKSKNERHEQQQQQQDTGVVVGSASTVHETNDGDDDDHTDNADSASDESDESDDDTTTPTTPTTPTNTPPTTTTTTPTNPIFTTTTTTTIIGSRSLTPSLNQISQVIENPRVLLLIVGTMGYFAGTIGQQITTHLNSYLLLLLLITVTLTVYRALAFDWSYTVYRWYRKVQQFREWDKQQQQQHASSHSSDKRNEVK